MATYMQKGNKHEAGPSEGGLNLANLAEVDLGTSETDISGHYAFGVGTSIHKNEWIVDSGTSNHMCCSLELLINLRKLKQLLQNFYLMGAVFGHF